MDIPDLNDVQIIFGESVLCSLRVFNNSSSNKKSEDLCIDSVYQALL